MVRLAGRMPLRVMRCEVLRVGIRGDLAVLYCLGGCGADVAYQVEVAIRCRLVSLRRCGICGKKVSVCLACVSGLEILQLRQNFCILHIFRSQNLICDSVPDFT